jgi:UDP-glucose 4-epimerase
MNMSVTEVTQVLSGGRDTARPTRALITGGTGFVGGHLAAELLHRGYEVTAFDNLSTGPLDNVAWLLDHPRFRVVVGDVVSDPVLDDLVAASDIVFHLAAVVGVELVVEDALTTIQTNVLGTESVLRAAARHGVKVMLASTSEVYGKCLSLPAREDDDVLLGPSLSSRWSYAASKLADEFLALAYHRQHGLPVVVFRLFNTVGPRQTGRYGMVVPRFVAAALEGRPIPVHGDGLQSRSFLHVRDAIDAILGLADEPAAEGRVFNVGSSAEITILDLARTVVEATRARTSTQSKLVFVPYDEAYAPGFEDIRRRVPDTTRIRELIGWQPRHGLDVIIDDVAADLSNRTDRRGSALAGLIGTVQH